MRTYLIREDVLDTTIEILTLGASYLKGYRDHLNHETIELFNVVDKLIEIRKSDTVEARWASFKQGRETPDDNMSDIEADADALRSAGMGTDEDYGSDRI
jgi:hemerythrin-like domain-containing protein